MNAARSSAILFALSLGAIGAASSTAQLGDLERLQGEWVAQVRTPISSRKITVRLTVQDTQVTWSAVDPISNEERSANATLVLDELQTPKQFDLRDWESEEYGRRLPDLRGVYELDGDKLILRVPASSDGERPTRVEPDDGKSPLQTVSFQRVPTD